MKKPVIKRLQLSWWFFYIAFFCGVYLLPESTAQNELPQLAALALLTGMISFYITWHRLFPEFARTGNRLKLFIEVAIASLLSALPGLTIIIAEVFWTAGIVPELSVSLSLLAGLCFLALLNTVAAITLKGFTNWYRAEREKELLEKYRLQAELSQIRTQLQPHFLFNTIHNIDILIESDPVIASAYLQKLAGLLRYTLYETSDEMVSLDQEISFIRSYLELQQLRTSNSNYTSFAIEGDSRSWIIPPLLLIPFIENAFKHTPDKKQQNAITIRLQLKPGKLHFICSNKTTPKNSIQAAPGGLGLTLIRQKLELFYKKNFSLTINEIDSIFKVDLTISNEAELHSN